jgi:hypothetical protein
MKQLTAPALILAGLCLPGCGDDDDATPDLREERVAGETGTLAGRLVSTFATLNERGEITEVGVTLPRAAILDTAMEETVIAHFPSQSVDQTGFDHLQLGFLPHGHPPAFWEVPHFDIHYHRVSVATREGIDCNAEPMPAVDRLPEGYIIPGTGPEPEGSCVPAMGIHAHDASSPEVAGSKPFDETMILGYHGGELTFIEPMVTKERLETTENLDRAIPAPARLADPARFATRFTMTHLAEGDSYELVISDFENIEEARGTSRNMETVSP